MKRPTIVIADTDVNYIRLLQHCFIKEFKHMINLEVITDPYYFNTIYTNLHPTDILIVSNDMFSPIVQKQNIEYIFVLSEKNVNYREKIGNIMYIYKYANIENVFENIVEVSHLLSYKSREYLNRTKIISFFTGFQRNNQTLLSIAISASIAMSKRKVLYINSSYMQVFQYYLSNNSPIHSMQTYLNLNNDEKELYDFIKEEIRNEIFDYLPPFKAPLLNLGLDYSIFKDLMLSAKQSNDYDYIIIDCDSIFNKENMEIIKSSDKVVILTNDDDLSITFTNSFVSSISDISSDKYIFINNDSDEKEKRIIKSYKEDLIISPFTREEWKDFHKLFSNSGVQRIVSLIVEE